MQAIQTINGLTPLDLAQTSDQSAHIHFSAQPGLYQFSVIADASQFDWEELYFNLHNYHNTGQRTGPWDFSLVTEGKKNPPLVPAYWVTVDGKKIGLWFFQRVSLEDLENKQFRGRMAFHIEQAGDHELTLKPYRPMNISWTSALLEIDPDDCLAELPANLKTAPDNAPVAAWTDLEFWKQQRHKLDTTHAKYKQPLERAFDWALAQDKYEPIHLPLLIGAYYLGDRSEALPLALQSIDSAMAAPAWGNPNPDGYSHNGDMAAAFTIKNLAWSFHMLGDSALGADRSKRLLEKLRHQGQVFFELALLNRDYWGGSLLQDHGWRSMFAFATAALHLYDIIPEARIWISYALPRIRRALQAMPRDGAIPPSSYSSLLLYVSEIVACRTALLALSNEDLYDIGQFHAVVDFVNQTIRRDEPVMLLSRNQQGGAVEVTYGQTFFNQMAAKYHDGTAAYLSNRVRQAQLNIAKAQKAYHNNGQYEDTLWAFFDYDPDVAPKAPTPQQSKLSYYPDSGVVHYHNPVHDITAALRCGPWCGWHADRSATGPCDRIGNPVSGHFVIFKGTAQLLVNPDSTYKLNTAVRNCLLVDGQGQIGDVGYPMSIPSWKHPGEEIQNVYWDESTNTGLVRLDLKPDYPDALGMALYTRELLFNADGKIICRDHLVFNKPRQLSWLFHGLRDAGVNMETDMRCQIGDEPSLTIEPRSVDVALQASIHPTELVYGYSSAFKEFDHVRYDSTKPVTTAMIEFVFS